MRNNIFVGVISFIVVLSLLLIALGASPSAVGAAVGELYEVSWAGAAENGWYNPLGSGTKLVTSTGYDFDSEIYITNYGKRHAGLDIVTSNGTKVHAIAAGTVERVFQSGEYNEALLIRHNSREGHFFAVYGHIVCSEGLTKNSTVEYGQEIGTIRSGGDPDHLHFGINICETVDEFIYGSYGWGRVPVESNPEDVGWRDPIEYLETTGSGGDGGPVDVVLIIDDSGSMSWNDPSYIRREAARVFVDAMQDDDQIGIVAFTGSSRTLWSIQPVGSDRTQIKNSLNSLSSYGGTSLSAGLSAGFNQLVSVESSGNKKAAVFLTDGVGSYNNEAQMFANKGWPIYVLGLGDDLNESLLQKIADDSGGMYRHLDPDFEILLQCVYYDIAQQIAGGIPILDYTVFLSLAQSWQWSVHLPINLLSASFLASWNGSTVDMSLVSPSGTCIGPDTTDPDVYHAKGLTYELYRITNPEAGDWIIHLYGSDLPPEGESVIVQAAILGPTGPPVDTTPPTTSLTIGSPQYTDGLGNTYVTSTTEFTLDAIDNGGDGSGVATTAYRVSNTTYSTGWITYTAPFNFAGFSDSTYTIAYNSTDNAGNIEPINTAMIILDNAGPSVTILNPPSGWALQDGVTFTASAVDSGSGVHSLNISIREANGAEGIPVGFEDLPAIYNPITGEWTLFFDTLLLPDGYYTVLAKAKDNLGNTSSTLIVPYSIRNWAVLELLPASQNNKGGRTMPVKFSLRVAPAVDPSQPFVYNEELAIKIFATSNPSNILQMSTFGDTARDYRIDTSSELYITNFRTLKTPMQYTVDVCRDTFVIGSFTFSTVK